MELLVENWYGRHTLQSMFMAHDQGNVADPCSKTSV